MRSVLRAFEPTSSTNPDEHPMRFAKLQSCACGTLARWRRILYSTLSISGKVSVPASSRPVVCLWGDSSSSLMAVLTNSSAFFSLLLALPTSSQLCAQCDSSRPRVPYSLVQMCIICTPSRYLFGRGSEQPTIGPRKRGNGILSSAYRL